MADKKKCFVVGPIGARGSETRLHADWLYHEIVLRVFDTHYKDEFEVSRSDTIDTPGMIDSQIINLLIDADLVIADMSELNPNAFYELGIRHMAQKPIIHMFLTGTIIPFDVKPHRAIEFDRQHPGELEAARASLAKAVSEAMSESHTVDNPVTRATGKKKIEIEALPEIQLLQAEFQSLREEVQRMRSGMRAAPSQPDVAGIMNLDAKRRWAEKMSIAATHPIYSTFIIDFETPEIATALLATVEGLSKQRAHFVDAYTEGTTIILRVSKPDDQPKLFGQIRGLKGVKSIAVSS